MNLAQILQADQDCQQVYFSQQTHNRIEVIKTKEHMWLTINHVVQSAIELSPPYRPALPHCMVMLLPLIHDKVPEYILELGGGAQSAQRYLNHSQIGIRFTSVEADKEVIKLTRDLFPAGEKLNIIESDAFKYLNSCVNQKCTFDWLIVDLFHGADSPVDAEHYDFFENIEQCLTDEGWLILNCLYPEAERRMDLARQIKQVFGYLPHMFAVPQMQNHIMLLRKGGKFCFLPEIEQHNLL